MGDCAALRSESKIDYAEICSPARHELERARLSVATDFARIHGRAATADECDAIVARYWYRISDSCYALLQRQRARRRRKTRAA